MGLPMGGWEGFFRGLEARRVERPRGKGEQCVTKTELVAKAELLELTSQWAPKRRF